jgi:hypothetical protein
MKNLLIESQYLSSLEYFYHILHHEIVYIESCESYQKQSYRNRCRILGANKVENLTVPVIHRKNGILIREVEIDHRQHWMRVHRRTIESAYRKAPYFQFYWDYFEKIYVKKHRYLFDLNIELFTICLQLLGLKKNIEFTSEFRKNTSEETVDFRNRIHPKKSNKDQIITWPPYNQLFGSNFVNNLSIVDLLFNEGPASVKILEKGKNQSY